MGHLPHHAHSHRLDTGSAQATRDGAEVRPLTFHIDGHSQHRVNQRHAVGSRLFHRLGYLHYTGHVGRKLYYQCLVIHFAYLTHHLRSHFGISPEPHSAFLHIGAADVQLNARNILQSIHLFCHAAILLNRRAAHVHQYIGIDVFDAGIHLLAESGYTHILQPYSIQHARRGLGHTRIRVALAAFSSSAFHYDSAQTA